MIFRRRKPAPEPETNPATLISATDIVVKTAHKLSTAEWLALDDDQRRQLRLSVVSAHERNAA